MALVATATNTRVRQPRFDRGALRSGIVHLGLGAFARGPLAVMTDDAIEHDGDLRWGITGVSLRHAAVRDALAPKEGLYTLALRHAQGERLRIIGSVLGVMVAPGTTTPAARTPSTTRWRQRCASCMHTQRRMPTFTKAPGSTRVLRPSSAIWHAPSR